MNPNQIFIIETDLQFTLIVKEIKRNANDLNGLQMNLDALQTNSNELQTLSTVLVPYSNTKKGIRIVFLLLKQIFISNALQMNSNLLKTTSTVLKTNPNPLQMNRNVLQTNCYAFKRIRTNCKRI